MNPYLKNLNRIEFPVTFACTGRCRHCSEGDHEGAKGAIDADAAVRAVRGICGAYAIDSLMTFGGEPLLYPDVVCRIHEAARGLGIPNRQLITNGYFSKEPERIREVARRLAESGVTDILLSVDAFHQETIPLAPVKLFASAVLDAARKSEKGGDETVFEKTADKADDGGAAPKAGQLRIRLNPAYLVSEEDDNPYNLRTRQIIGEFREMGIDCASGNVIFPSGNALKYLGEYFIGAEPPENPYKEDPRDVRAISISPNGDTSIGKNVYRTDILAILEAYLPLPERGADERENTDVQEAACARDGQPQTQSQADPNVRNDQAQPQADSSVRNGQAHPERAAGVCPCCGAPYRESDGSVPAESAVKAERSASDAEAGENLYRICANCFWENDPAQLRDPDFAGGANAVSLSEARENVRRFGVCEERFIKIPKATEGESRAAYRPRNNPR